MRDPTDGLTRLAVPSQTFLTGIGPAAMLSHARAGFVSFEVADARYLIVRALMRVLAIGTSSFSNIWERPRLSAVHLSMARSYTPQRPGSYVAADGVLLKGLSCKPCFC